MKIIRKTDEFPVNHIIFENCIFYSLNIYEKKYRNLRIGKNLEKNPETG